MNYIKPTPAGVDPDTRDKANEIGRPLTSKSDRPRSTWGSLAVSVQTVRGLCTLDRKCVKKENHGGLHWPASTE